MTDMNRVLAPPGGEGKLHDVDLFDVQDMCSVSSLKSKMYQYLLIIFA